MGNLSMILDKIGREVTKMEIDYNPNLSYIQKSIAKAHIDGRCDFNTYLNRVNNYLSEYCAREFYAQTRYYYQQPIFY